MAKQKKTKRLASGPQAHTKAHVLALQGKGWSVVVYSDGSVEKQGKPNMNAAARELWQAVEGVSGEFLHLSEADHGLFNELATVLQEHSPAHASRLRELERRLSGTGSPA